MSMPSLKPLPQELIDKVIDELGEVYWDVSNKKHPDNRIVAQKTLHACTLVSKNWTGRSRMHLFKEVKIRADDFGVFPIPPGPLMLYVTKLRIQMRSERYRLFPSPKLLKPFHTAPITHLGIVAGALASSQACLVECIVALSATLRTVTFASCSLSPDLILDIVLKHPDLKRLFLRCCEVKPTYPNNYAEPPLGTHFTDLELGIFSAVGVRGQDLTVTAVAQLPIHFSKLDFDYMHGLQMTRSSNALIRANAESLSSLTVHIINSTFWGREIQPLFSLGNCFNLYELTLDMEGTILCPLTTSTNTLSTFDPKRSTHLELIKLKTACSHEWHCNRSRDRLVQAWSNLDMILSELAKVANDTEGKKLTFVLAPTHKTKCMSFGKKWLPELLPRFHELGELRVEYERGRLQTQTDHECFCNHAPTCQEKVYNNTS